MDGVLLEGADIQTCDHAFQVYAVSIAILSLFLLISCWSFRRYTTLEFEICPDILQVLEILFSNTRALVIVGLCSFLFTTTIRLSAIFISLFCFLLAGILWILYNSER